MLSSIKSNAIFALKVIVVLAVASALANLAGVSLLGLISNPVATVKGLVAPKSA